MRCPKCHYIGFESVDRCRNCGYDFSLAVESPAKPDLKIRTDPPAPYADFALGGLERHANQARTAQPLFDLEQLRTAPAAAARELPLFEPPDNDEAPLISAPAVPRPPLAVRRPTPDLSRLRRTPRTDLAAAPRLELQPATPSLITVGEALESAEPAAESAPLGSRFGAAAIDVCLLAFIDAGVLYFTLRIAGLTLAQISILPVGPLLAFILLLNGGYLFGMTATGGQTIGKMAFGLRVVDNAGDSVPLGRVALRAGASMVSAAAAGLGFVAALIDSDRLTLHDRLARTRVIRVLPGA